MEAVKCYYKSPVSLAQAEKYIEASLVTTAREYVAIGHWLRRIRDDKLFLEEGYKNFEEYVRQKYHKDAGWASKCIKVNAQFSVGGNSPHLSEEYRSYSKYQLVELAYMSEGQRELVGPDTPVRAMKQIRKPEVVTSQVDPAPDPQGEEPEEKVVTSQSERVAESAAVQEPEFEEEQPAGHLSAYGTPRNAQFTASRSVAVQCRHCRIAWLLHPILKEPRKKRRSTRATISGIYPKPRKVCSGSWLRCWWNGVEAGWCWME